MADIVNLQGNWVDSRGPAYRAPHASPYTVTIVLSGRAALAD